MTMAKQTLGPTLEHNLKENVLQGDTLSSIIASNQVDIIGKKLLKKNPDYLFRYKDIVPIGVMEMVDDTVTVTEAGHKTQQMNAYFNVQAAEKRLQFSEFKCHTMTIHKSKQINAVSELKVDIWKQTHDDNNCFHETFDYEHNLKDTIQTKYLGCMLSNDGSNSQNIKMKVNKAFGTRKMIKTLIKGLGKYTVESGIVYFKSLLRGSMLFATEVMMNLSVKDVKLIEKSEEASLRDLVKTQCSAPRHILYLELGIVPARFVIKQRKVMYLKHILMQDESSLLKKVVNAQIKSPSKGDWISDIIKILEDLDINKTFEEIKIMPKKTLSNIVKLSIEKLAFSYLIAIQKQKKKGKEINYSNISLQPYFRPRENINLISQREIFALRSQMNNFEAKFCPSTQIKKCEKSHKNMDNYHLFKCSRKNIKNITYEHILNGTVLEQKNAIHYLNKKET